MIIGELRVCAYRLGIETTEDEVLRFAEACAHGPKRMMAAVSAEEVR